MIKKILIVTAILFSVVSSAQETTSSPYSFFGIGLLKFNGTVENKSMGGMSVYADSIHLNLKNPAAYSDLLLTTYTVGASHSIVNSESDLGEAEASSTSIDYIAIGIPVSRKFGFGFGLIPYSSVGYRLVERNEDVANQFTGRGGLNRVFLSAGYKITKNFALGAEANYSFGNIQNKSLLFQRELQYGTRELNRSDINGFSYKLGLNYEGNINEDLQVEASAYYTPSSNLTTENQRRIATVILDSEGQDQTIEESEVQVSSEDMSLPAEYSLGAGIGQKNNWFVGLEYAEVEAGGFSNRSFSIQDAYFENATSYRIGGFWIPEYNSLTNYFDRITYRAGFRFEETGLVKANQPINEFGISFGVGLPVGDWFSNANIGVEYGQRGTTSAGLVKEKFFNLFISLSLNDRWFIKNKYN